MSDSRDGPWPSTDDGQQDTGSSRAPGEQKISARDLDWMLGATIVSSQPSVQPYGDLTALNTHGLIKNAIDPASLQSVAADVLSLLGTSCAIYEENGDYAFGIFSSGWCQVLDAAAFARCGTDDVGKALGSGQWLCHESCWKDASRESMLRDVPVDIECHGGLRLYAVPIRARGSIIGSINMGYGSPPSEEARISEIASNYGIPVETLKEKAEEYCHRPPFIIGVAKLRLHNAATLIGSLVERFLADQALRESERKLQEAVTAGNIGLWNWDLETNRVEYSEIWKQQIGHAPEEIGDSLDEWRSRVHPDEIDHVMDQVKAMLADKKRGIRVEFRFRHKDGSYRHILAHASVIVDSDGSPLRVLGSHIDISHVTETQDELLQTVKELRLAQRIANIGNWSLDPEVGVPQWSEEIYRIYKRDPALGPYPVADYQTIYKGRWLETFQSAIRSAIDDGEPYDIELRLELPSGTTKWVRAICEPLPEKGPKGHCLLGTIQDISEERLLREQLAQLEKMDAIGHLAGGVAHDFNNQLAAILGYADLLAEKLEDPTFKRYAENICTAAQRGGDLTSKLLAFSRSGHFSSEAVDIHSIVNETVEMLSRSVDKRIRIEQALNAERRIVVGDPSQLQNAVLNLAINARDAISGAGTISFATDEVSLASLPMACEGFEIEAGDFIRITVTDTGCGMTESTKSRLFEPFFTTKGDQGTGMGLASVFGTVKQHNGCLGVESEVGEGSSFAIFLPLDDSVPRRVTTPLEATEESSSLNILVVDDEEIVRTLSCEMLAELGHRTLSAADGQEAIDLYRETWRDIDLVILDMIMPKVDGREAFRVIRTINPRANVLIASGYSQNKDTQDIIAEGALGILQKPFDVKTLAAVIAEATRSCPTDSDSALGHRR